MAAVSYGHVAIVPKGVWSAEVQYEPCHLVEYNGSSYVAKLQPPIGTLPTDTQYWQVSAVGAKKATLDSLGLVKPDNKTIEVDETGVLSVKESTDIIKKSDGTLSLNTTFEEATELANIIAGEAIKEVLGKVSKSIATTMNLDQNALLKNMLSGEDVDDASKIPTSAFVHTLYNRIGMGTDLSAGDATNLTQAVNNLNSNLNSLIKIAEVGVTDAIPINPSSKEVNTSISFQKSYTDPIVIATLCGGQGYVGAGCKVMSIKNNGATFKTYTTSPVGSDYSFYISYLVVVKNNQFKLA